MNQRLLWTVVAILSTILGTPSITRAQTVNEALITSQEAPEKNTVSVNANGSRTTVTKIYAHKLAGRQAATLYLRNIPVLTFLSSDSVANKEVTAGANNQDSSTKALVIKGN